MGTDTPRRGSVADGLLNEPPSGKHFLDEEGAALKRLRTRGGGLVSLLLFTGALTILTVSFIAVQCWRQVASSQASSSIRRLADGGEEGGHQWPSLKDLCFTSDEEGDDSDGSSSGGTTSPDVTGLYDFPKIRDPKTKRFMQAVLKRLQDLSHPQETAPGITAHRSAFSTLRLKAYVEPRRGLEPGWPSPESIHEAAERMEASLLKLMNDALRRGPGASEVLELSVVKREAGKIVAKIKVTLFAQNLRNAEPEIFV